MRQQRGMTLVELMITLTIIGILLTIAATTFSRWIGNLKIRGAAESIEYGMQLARSEAVKRNRLVYFTLVDSLNPGCANVATAVDLLSTQWNWIVSTDRAVTLNCPVPGEATGVLQERAPSEGSGVSDIRVNVTFAEIAFDGLGRLANAAGNNVIQVSMGGTAGCGSTDQTFRCLNVQVASPGGQIRICDPAVTNAADPRFCI